MDVDPVGNYSIDILMENLYQLREFVRADKPRELYEINAFWLDLADWCRKNYPDKIDWVFYKYIPYVWLDISNCYADGIGCEKNTGEASKFHRMGVEGLLAYKPYTDTQAEYVLEFAGDFQRQPDMKWFRYFFTKIANQDQSLAAKILQHMKYAEQMPMELLGSTTEADIQLLQQYADQKNHHAEYLLGRCLYYGKGVAKNEDLGIEYLNRASQGVYFAADRLENLIWESRSKYHNLNNVVRNRIEKCKKESLQELGNINKYFEED